MNSDYFYIETGVRQGDVLSLLLFVIFMDRCMRDVNAGEFRDETFFYADDVAEVVDNEVALQNIGDIWNAVMRQKCKKINTAYGKIQFIHGSRIIEQFNIS